MQPILALERALDSARCPYHKLDCIGVRLLHGKNCSASELKTCFLKRSQHCQRRREMQDHLKWDRQILSTHSTFVLRNKRQSNSTTLSCMTTVCRTGMNLLQLLLYDAALLARLLSNLHTARKVPSVRSGHATLSTQPTVVG